MSVKEARTGKARAEMRRACAPRIKRRFSRRSLSALSASGRGASLIELLMIIGFIAILASIIIVGLGGRRHQLELQTTTQQIVSLLREAQSRSVAQDSGTGWGVRFENSTSTRPFYGLFSAADGWSTSTAAGYYRLPAGVEYQTSTLAVGAALEITFSQISGLASASTSIGLFVSGNEALSSTISVASSGAVSH